MKKLIATTAAFSSYLLSPALAFADTVDTCPTGDFAGLCKLTSSNFGNVVGNVITLLFILAVLIALGFLIWGGIKWILSGGDKTNVEAARNTIVAAVVGLVIVFLAYFILNLGVGFFLGKTITTFTLPTLKLQ